MFHNKYNFINGKNYYEVLGLEAKGGATSDEIKNSFRKKMLVYHPDKNRGSIQAQETTQQIVEAYDILKDRESREEYDRYLRSVKPSKAQPLPAEKKEEKPKKPTAEKIRPIGPKK